MLFCCCAIVCDPALKQHRVKVHRYRDHLIASNIYHAEAATMQVVIYLLGFIYTNKNGNYANMQL